MNIAFMEATIFKVKAKATPDYYLSIGSRNKDIENNVRNILFVAT